MVLSLKSFSYAWQNKIHFFFTGVLWLNVSTSSLTAAEVKPIELTSQLLGDTFWGLVESCHVDLSQDLTGP